MRRLPCSDLGKIHAFSVSSLSIFNEFESHARENLDNGHIKLEQAKTECFYRENGGDETHSELLTRVKLNAFYPLHLNFLKVPTIKLSYRGIFFLNP